MSASGIADAFVTMLAATSAFGATAVGKDYSVLETSAGSAVVVQWTGMEMSHDTFGSPTTKGFEWTFLLLAYSKDTGAGVLPRTLSVVDAVVNVVKNDDTIQGTVERVVDIRASRNPDEAFDAGGATWLRMPIEVDVLEWPDG